MIDDLFVCSCRKFLPHYSCEHERAWRLRENIAKDIEADCIENCTYNLDSPDVVCHLHKQAATVARRKIGTPLGIR